MTFHPPQPLLPSHLSPHHSLSPHLAYSPAQIPIARRNDVALVLLHALTQAVVRICALVHAGDALTAGVLQGGGGTLVHAGDALTAGVLQGEGVSLVHAGDALTAGVLQGEGGSEQETVLQAGKALSAM